MDFACKKKSWTFWQRKNVSNHCVDDGDRDIDDDDINDDDDGGND